MRAPVSVIIPTLNAEKHLPGCLLSLFEGMEAGVIRDVIVVDGGSVDQTCRIAQEAGATVVDTAPSRGGQIATGQAHAHGDWVMVLHADTQLSEGWSAVAAEHLSTPKAGYFRLSFEQGGMMGRWVAGWANWRARAFDLPYGDQGMLLPRSLLENVGGYPDMPLMEDVALAQLLKGKLIALDAVAVTSPEKYQSQGWLRRSGKNLWTLARYFFGVSPQSLAQSYRR
ncbi:glycosyltransferase [Shimia litoralis]|uniref:Glycosyltransferase n=1 Tax=Shimia litoralis TaxID=420403 RepID=A0A4U7N4N5_9RHOB|nr:TIGR04283 family arsenosugar biosynthesis glycosyltransferase [Shimia litoralis]TKZ20513.1 glycosyltransferase [Shimia litoralis]